MNSVVEFCWMRGLGYVDYLYYFDELKKEDEVKLSEKEFIEGLIALDKEMEEHFYGEA